MDIAIFQNGDQTEIQPLFTTNTVTNVTKLHPVFSDFVIKKHAIRTTSKHKNRH